MTQQQQMPSKQEIHTNDNESFISDQCKQYKRRRKESRWKRKWSQKIGISENISNKQRSNDDEFTYAEIDSIIDQQCSIKFIPVENNVSLDLDLLQ